MYPRDGYDPIDVIVKVLRDLFPGAPLTEGAEVPSDVRELGFRHHATCFLIHHGRRFGDTVTLLIGNELLAEPDLEARLRAAELPALVAEHPRGIIGLGGFRAIVMGEG